MVLQTGRIEFPGADGQVLAARIDLPPGPVRAWALFAHCFSCSKDVHAAHRIARRLAAHGLGVMRFDFTGLGQSEGDFANTNFSTNVQDLLAAANWLQAETGGPHLLIGHSLGGAAAIVAGGQIESVKAVATLGAPADADHVLAAFDDQVADIETDGEAEVHLAGRPFTIKRQFLDDVRGASVRDAASALRKPLLILHAPLDDIVGIENATGLFTAARHPKSFISLDMADHLLSEPGEADHAAEAIAGWVGRYLPSGDAAMSAPSSPIGAEVYVSETGRSAYEVSVRAGAHSMLADEPVSVGGGGAGPDPYDYVAAGLGACTAMTLRMYASRKDWPLEKVSVSVSHEKSHAEDCAQCEKGRKVDVFTRTLHVQGALDDDQRARLVEIAEKCPVHRTLMEPNMIRTHLAGDSTTANPVTR
ncbi:MAG: bifunctional alpha/beta hydrolase/OsmC family protein [Hyphomonadaceae bacterium]|nr:bifunctional alpha/beta hydrolase/OsmC family protein [Hyphomonadaceae bacterium]